MESMIKWEPIKNISSKYYVEAVSDGINGFSVTLLNAKDEHNKLIIKFGNSVNFFKSTTETFTYKRLDALVEKYGLNFITDWTLFKISNSEDIQWMVNESYGMTTGSEFTHYCIFAIDSVIDVIAGDEPEVIQVDN